MGLGQRQLEAHMPTIGGPRTAEGGWQPATSSPALGVVL